MSRKADAGIALPPDERARFEILINLVLSTARRILIEDFGIELRSKNAEEREPTIETGELTSSLDIRGAAEGTIFLSCGQEMAKLLLRKILPGELLPGDEEVSMLEEALNETLNLIVGNCTQALSMTGLPISVFPPNSVHKDESVVQVVLVNNWGENWRLAGRHSTLVRTDCRKLKQYGPHHDCG